MRTEHFKYFAVVAKEGSFSKAARKLYLSEPTLNKNITSFEAELGFKLFVRSKRCLLLTPEGEQFLPMAEKISETIEESVASIREAASRKEFQLRVNHVALDSDDVFNEALLQLMKLSPRIELVLCEGDPKSYRERLLGSTRDTDIEFTVLNGVGMIPPSLDYRVIHGIRETIVVPKSHPLANKASATFSDIGGRRLVFSSAFPNEAHLQLIKDIEGYSSTNGSIEYMFVNSISSALRLCDYYDHCMVKTNMYTVPDGYVAIPLETSFTSTLCALWNKANPSTTLRRFVEILDKTLERMERSDVD